MFCYVLLCLRVSKRGIHRQTQGECSGSGFRGPGGEVAVLRIRWVYIGVYEFYICLYRFYIGFYMFYIYVFICFI